MLAKSVALLALAAIVLGSEHVIPNNDCEDITSRVCQNFDEARQNAINTQINMELRASYVYMAMATYFNRDDPNLKGFAQFFSAASLEEREHATKLIDYLNSRGGKVMLTAIQAPSKHEWSHGLEAVTDALQLERDVNEALLRLHAGAHNDPHLQDFLETHYLTEQVDSIRELSGFVSQLTRLRVTNPGLGEHMFDSKLLN